MSNSTHEAPRAVAVAHDGRVLKITVRVESKPSKSVITEQMRAEYEARRKERARKERRQ